MPNLKIVSLISVFLLVACSGQPERPQEPEKPAPVISEIKALPAIRPFPEDTFFELLVAEFAIRRQQFDVALANYIYQARRTRDVGVVSTAARLAHYMNVDQPALESALVWLELEPDAAEAHYIAAAILARKRQPLDAIPHMIKVLESGNESNFAALAASALTLPEEQQQEFLAHLDTLISDYPQETAPKTAKALMLQYRQQEEEALTLIRQVLKQEPEDIHALLIETRLLIQLDRNKEARKRLAAAVDMHPGHKRLRLQFAQLLTLTDLQQARAQYSVLVRQFPQDGDILLAQALVYREIGELEESRSALQQLKGFPGYESRAHFFLGALDEQEENWRGAIEHYAQVSPGEDYNPAMRRLAVITASTYGLESARDQLQLQRKNNPNQQISLLMIESDLLYDREQFQQGHRLLSESLKENPEEPNLLYARALFSERLSKLDQMEADLRVILDEDPENATALNALGYSLANHTNRLDEAMDLVEKALRIRPDDPAIQDSYGWIAFLQGDIEVAHRYLSQAFEQMPDHEIAAHLGEVLWAMGRTNEAINVWRDGLKDRPDSPIIQETMKRLNVTDDAH